MARAYEGLPDDLLNFHYDPVACAVALGWDGADVQQARLLPEFEGGVLCFRHDREGIPMQVVVDLDPSGFAETWLRCVAAV